MAAGAATAHHRAEADQQGQPRSTRASRVTVTLGTLNIRANSGPPPIRPARKRRCASACTRLGDRCGHDTADAGNAAEAGEQQPQWPRRSAGRRQRENVRVHNDFNDGSVIVCHRSSCAAARHNHTERRPAARLPQTVIAMQPIQLFRPPNRPRSPICWLIRIAGRGHHRPGRSPSWSVISPRSASRTFRLLWTIETHAHADHITSAAQLIEHTGAQAATRRLRHPACGAAALQDGDVINFGDETLTLRFTPGHNGGQHVVPVAIDHVGTGDTLLIDGCGQRTDFSPGRPTRSTPALPDACSRCRPRPRCGPVMTTKGRTKSTIGHERAHNSRRPIAVVPTYRADGCAASAQTAAHRRGQCWPTCSSAFSITPHADDSNAPRVAAVTQAT